MALTNAQRQARYNARHPRYVTGPPSLSDEARRVWNEVVQALRAAGTYAESDHATIEAFVQAVVRHRRLTAALDREGIVVDGKLHPAARTIEATAATVKNLGHILGLNPAARKQRSASAAKGRTSTWADVLLDNPKPATSPVHSSH
jgi:P27 family predicted phage terminase small subunit